LLTWLPQLTGLDGIAVKSPATGMVLPLSAHPDLLYNANVLALALCIKLQHGTLTAPFAGHYSACLQSNRRLRFRHSSGLTAQLDLPHSVTNSNGKGMITLTHTDSMVRAGQPVVKLDLQYLQNDNSSCYAVLMLLPHPAIQNVFCAEHYVEAASDTAIIIQLNNK
jgi:PTS system glucose-specific IIA component